MHTTRFSNSTNIVSPYMIHIADYSLQRALSNDTKHVYILSIFAELTSPPLLLAIPPLYYQPHPSSLCGNSFIANYEIYYV